MAKLRSSTIVRHYDPDDEDRPRRRRGRDPIREIARAALLVLILWLLYQMFKSYPH